MFAGLYAKLIGLAVIAALIGGAALYMHHMGAASQKVVDDAKYSTLQTLSDSYKQQVRNDATSMLKINRDAATAKSYADLQKSFATAALQQVASDRIAMRAMESARKVAVTKAESTSACDTRMSGQMCTPMRHGY